MRSKFEFLRGITASKVSGDLNKKFHAMKDEKRPPQKILYNNMHL